MPETQPIPEPCEREARIDGLVLDLLIDSDDQRPRAVDEVIREHANERDARDALSRLHAFGLIHRTPDGFVWASRAAIRYSQIAR